MCKLCEAEDVIERIDRVISADKEGQEINADGLVSLLSDARASISSLHQVLALSRLMVEGGVVSVDLINVSEIQKGKAH